MLAAACAGKCFIACSLGEMKALICSVCQFPWCKYGHIANFKLPTRYWEEMRTMNSCWPGQAASSTLLVLSHITTPRCKQGMGPGQCFGIRQPNCWDWGAMSGAISQGSGVATFRYNYIPNATWVIHPAIQCKRGTTPDPLLKRILPFDQHRHFLLNLTSIIQYVCLCIDMDG